MDGTSPTLNKPEYMSASLALSREQQQLRTNGTLSLGNGTLGSATDETQDEEKKEDNESSSSDDDDDEYDESDDDDTIDEDRGQDHAEHRLIANDNASLRHAREGATGGPTFFRSLLFSAIAMKLSVFISGDVITTHLHVDNAYAKMFARLGATISVDQANVELNQFYLINVNTYWSAIRKVHCLTLHPIFLLFIASYPFFPFFSLVHRYSEHHLHM